MTQGQTCPVLSLIPVEAAGVHGQVRSRKTTQDASERILNGIRISNHLRHWRELHHWQARLRLPGPLPSGAAKVLMVFPARSQDQHKPLHCAGQAVLHLSDPEQTATLADQTACKMRQPHVLRTRGLVRHRKPAGRNGESALRDEEHLREYDPPGDRTRCARSHRLAWAIDLARRETVQLPMPPCTPSRRWSRPVGTCGRSDHLLQRRPGCLFRCCRVWLRHNPPYGYPTRP